MINQELLDKSFVFSLRIIKMHRYMSKEFKEYFISKQILNLGLDLCEQLRKGLYARNQIELENKLHAVLEIAEATAYRIELLHALDYLNDKATASIMDDCREIQSLIQLELDPKTTQMISNNTKGASEEYYEENTLDSISEKNTSPEDESLEESLEEKEKKEDMSFEEWVESEDNNVESEDNNDVSSSTDKIQEKEEELN